MATQDPDHLMIREYPILMWLIGGGLLLVGAYGLSQSDGRIPGVIMMVVGAALALLARITTITIDRRQGMLALHKQAVLGRSLKEIPIRDITAVSVETTTSQSRRGGRSTVHRVVFTLTSGENVPMHGYYSSGYSGKARRARQLAEFLGVPGPAGEGYLQTAQQFARQVSTQKQAGVTEGISWQTEAFSMGATPVTRWFSPDFKYPRSDRGGFLLLAQKPKGASGFGGGLMGAVAQLAYRQILTVYGFQPEDTPGFEASAPLPALDPQLGQHFASLTNDPAGARQVLSPWVVQPLARWADARPLRTVQAAGQAGQLIALFSPLGVYVASMGLPAGEAQAELARLGVDLVKAVR
jgi:hypothetical protein